MVHKQHTCTTRTHAHIRTHSHAYTFVLDRNAQVVTFLNEGKRMAAPASCPDHIYSLMRQCWHKDVEGRPNFSELYQDLCENKGNYADDFPEVDP